MNTTLYGKVDGHELQEEMYVSFSWRVEYSEEPKTFEYPGWLGWECEEITEAQVFSDYKCEAGRDATEEEKEWMRQWVEDWELREVFDAAENINSE